MPTNTGMAKMFLAILAIASFAEKSTALTYAVVDTGIGDFSSDTSQIARPRPGQPFYGQDANYIDNWPSYQDNGDGTVSDLVTGLMWAQTPRLATYAQAVQAVRAYRVGGYSDWRLPTIKELYSLILFDGSSMGIDAGSMYFINTDVFDQPSGSPRPIDAQTISANEYTGFVFGNQKCNFGVNFIDGRIKCYSKNVAKYYRFVRGPTNYGLNNYTDNGDGTITDRATGLMWMKADSGRGMDWQNALNYCENATFAGRSDWRLPNSKQLESIVDYSRGPQTTNSAAINPMFQVTQVTLPDGRKDYPYFWSGTTHHDGPMPMQYACYVAFGQAWGRGFTNELVDVHGAGAQRSDPKSARGQSYPQFMGPQGDMRVVYNYARCVRPM